MEHVQCFVGGSSAGHIKPALQLAHRFRQKENGHTLFVSTTGLLDRHLVNESSVVDEHVMLHVVPRSRWHMFRRIKQVGGLFWACIKSIHMLQREFPDRVVMTGGIVSVPVCCAAWLLHIPIDVYEFNATPGKAVYYTSILANTTYICFSKTASYLPRNVHTVVTPYPVSEPFVSAMSQHDARMRVHLPNDMYVVLVLGGSQGSQYINNLMQHIVPRLDPQRYAFVHQTGSKEEEARLSALYQQYGYTATVFAFEHDLAPYYYAADMCIARAGAGTLAEVEASQCPVCIVPLEAASTKHHQLEPCPNQAPPSRIMS